MSLFVEVKGGRRYLYFKASRNKFYLGLEDNPDPERVKKALEYIHKRKLKLETVEKRLKELLEKG